MADPLPKVQYERKGNEPKVLTPSTPAELERLLSMGWKKVEDGSS